MAKLYAYWITVNYREVYDIFACNGILFNHESPVRGETFITRKMTRALTRISLGLQDCLYVGNLDAKRDWGHAKDFVEAQWLMLQQEKPVDLVIATGQQYSVRECIEYAASCVSMEIYWSGHGLAEVGKVSGTNKAIIKVDPRYFRPTEVDTLLGDASKANELLGWSPKVSFEELISEMIQKDLKLAQQELIIRDL